MRIERRVCSVDSYHLPVLAVVEAMKGSPTVVGIQSRLSSLPGISKDACLAHITLGQGQVYSCTITARTGAVLLQQQEALRALERCGDLDWNVSPLKATASQKDTQVQMGSPGQSMTNIPSLRGGLTTETLNSLPHPYRRIIMLVDGKRTIEDIALLASKTPQEVVRMLRALERLIHL
jgi:hypothetical protein